MILLVLAPSGVARADSASATLSVGVTVTRACVVATTPQDPGFATLRLTCAPGASANVRLSDALQTTASTPGGQGIRVPTSPAGSSPQGTTVRVVTLNF